MKKLNWHIILSNLAEAREQIEAIEARLKAGEKLNEVGLQILFEHTYHHLNFAWNARHASDKQYSRLTDAQFNQWSKFPEEIEAYETSDRSVEKR
jgi:hypothetical protein